MLRLQFVYNRINILSYLFIYEFVIYNEFAHTLHSQQGFVQNVMHHLITMIT
jgi:hypothetical protein